VKKLFLSVTLGLVLTACATPSTPHLTQAPIKVNQETIKDYWISQSDVQFFKRPTSAQLRAMEAQKVEIVASYLVDSNGDIFDVEIVESNVDISFKDLVEDSLEKRNFRPSQSNTYRQPIIVLSSFVFDTDHE
jgi:hypothetical protein